MARRADAPARLAGRAAIATSLLLRALLRLLAGHREAMISLTLAFASFVCLALGRAGGCTCIVFASPSFTSARGLCRRSTTADTTTGAFGTTTAAGTRMVRGKRDQVVQLVLLLIRRRRSRPRRRRAVAAAA